MNIDYDILVRLVIVVLLFGVWLAVVGGVLYTVHFFLALPMRRAERARLFLDLAETAIQSGQPVEQVVMSLARSRDFSMGVRFHLLAARLEQNLRLVDGLEKVPHFLPAQITSMLKAGQKIGDLRKVLPACRQLLKDAVSQTRGAINYLMVLTFVITPAGVTVFNVLQIKVLPKFLVLADEVGGNAASVTFLYQYHTALVLMQWTALLAVWMATLVYIGGPRMVSWLPLVDNIKYRLPWRRKRMQRDFSTMLAVLLDSGVPEPESLALAADCSANRVFRRRVAAAVERLRQGVKLTQAVENLDDSGEFGWRLANAIHGNGGFLKALAGWHESLDAKAFQQEQAAAHGITTGMVFWNGLFVGAVAVSVFAFLISLDSVGGLW